MIYQDDLGMPVSKVEQLSRCNIAFLRDLAEKINFSYRHYGHKSKSDLLKTLSNKLNFESVDAIVKMYLLCLDAEDVVREIKPATKEEIAKAVSVFFGSGESLRETSVGNRICDVVLLMSDEVIAIEVKSAVDRVSRAFEQVTHYKLWANKVYLAYDLKHKRKVKELALCDKGVGLLEYSEGEIKEECKALPYKPDNVTLFEFMTYQYLKKTARYFGVTVKGKKKEIAARLNKKVSREKTQKLFQHFLTSRASNREKATKPSVVTEQTYPLAQYSED